MTPDLDYRPAFLSPGDADQLLVRLQAEVSWEQHEVRLFGRHVPCPRLSAWYGDDGADYTYSGHRHRPTPWRADLAGLRDRLAAYAQTTFNTVLLNLYRSGADSMGWHADDEPELGPQPVIASISLGATRKLRFRRKGEHKVTSEVWLEHGSLLIMGGDTQERWQHALPRSKRVSEPRINLTFRKVQIRPV